MGSNMYPIKGQPTDMAVMSNVRRCKLTIQNASSNSGDYICLNLNLFYEWQKELFLLFAFEELCLVLNFYDNTTFSPYSRLEYASVIVIFTIGNICCLYKQSDFFTLPEYFTVE